MKPFTVDLEDLSERQKEREQADTREIFERIYQGSMPAIVSGINSNSQLFYSSYLSTYIERDVRELSDAIDSLKFLRFITAVAARCGQMVNAAEIARDIYKYYFGKASKAEKKATTALLPTGSDGSND